MKKVLVTGGAGFIGSHTSFLLLKRGYELVILDSYINSSRNAHNRLKNLINKIHPELNVKIDFIEGDVRDKDLLEKIFADAEKENKPICAVMHFAGLKSVSESVMKPMSYWDVNVFGSLSLIKVMETYECNTIIFSSSATIYDTSNNSLISEDYTIDPRNPYGNTKSTVELLLNDIFKSSPDKWRIANLRYFNPIGAHPSGLLGEDPLGKPNNIFPIICRVAAGIINQLNVFGNDWETIDGTGVRDYIHVLDLAEGHISSLEYLLNGKSKLINLNLGTAKGTSVLELINTFETVNNLKIPYIFSARREGDVASTIANNSLALTTLDWRPKRDLVDMCKDAWAWQLNQS